MATLGLALRTYARYAVPLTIVAGLVLAPLVVIALRVPAPADVLAARKLLQLAWLLAGTAWMFQLLLVGAAAPLARAVAAREAISQPRALGRALVQLGRALVPCVAAIATMLIGGLALVVPGLVLLVLLSLTSASPERGIPAALVDSVAMVREGPWFVAAVVGAMLVIDLAIVLAAWKLGAAPLVKQLPAAQLAAYRDVVRVLVLGLVIVSPMFAAVLAAARATRGPQGSPTR